MEIDLLRDLININIIAGLRSTRHRRVACRFRIQITHNQRDFLKQRHNVTFKMQSNDDVLDDLRLVRANFSTNIDFSKIADGSFKICFGKPRPVSYNTHHNGKLAAKIIQPPPILIIEYKRQDDKIQL